MIIEFEPIYKRKILSFCYITHLIDVNKYVMRPIFNFIGSFNRDFVINCLRNRLNK